jgi:alpha-mannosidase
LAEYEVLDRSIAVTLVRAVGELSRNDLPERPGHAGWPSPTPGAQCIGRYDAGFAVMLHGPRDTSTIDAIERTADDALSPLTGVTLRSALNVPDPVCGFELIGEGLAFSAIKQSEDGAWVVLRCVNLLDEPVPGMWRVPFQAAEANIARIDETIITNIEIQNNTVEFPAAPKSIVTVLVR